MANATMSACPSRSVAVRGAEMRFAQELCWRWYCSDLLVGKKWWQNLSNKP